MRRMSWLLAFGVWVGFLVPVSAEGAKPGGRAGPGGVLPTAGESGGLAEPLPEQGEPSAEQKSKIRAVAGVDWDKLAAAWEHNATRRGRPDCW